MVALPTHVSQCSPSTPKPTIKHVRCNGTGTIPDQKQETFSNEQCICCAGTQLWCSVSFNCEYSRGHGLNNGSSAQNSLQLQCGACTCHGLDERIHICRTTTPHSRNTPHHTCFDTLSHNHYTHTSTQQRQSLPPPHQNLSSAHKTEKTAVPALHYDPIPRVRGPSHYYSHCTTCAVVTAPNPKTITSQSVTSQISPHLT